MGIFGVDWVLFYGYYPAMELEVAFRRVAVQAIRNSPETTLDELVEVIRRYPDLGKITVGELLSGRPGATKVRGSTGRKKPAPVNTRSRPGRDAYRKALLAVLTEAPGWLIKKRHATYDGLARATKYSAA